VTTRDIVFAVIALIASVSALLAVTTRNLVHAALWLVVCLGTVAGCYVVLGAELVALVQVLIYVGAVVVLVLFALMLTRAPIGPNRELSSPWWQRILAAVLAVAVAVLLAVTLVPLVGEGPLESRNGDTTAVATAIFGTWVWPFELLSVLLLAALIGAFALAKVAGAGLVRTPRRRRRAPTPRPAAAESAPPPARDPGPGPGPETKPEAAAAPATASAREGRTS
jgi:NADH-quinone oxidoreductase subunit J